MVIDTATEERNRQRHSLFGMHVTQFDLSRRGGVAAAPWCQVAHFAVAPGAGRPHFLHVRLLRREWVGRRVHLGVVDGGDARVAEYPIISRQ